MNQKFIAARVIVKPCNIGYGYFYKGECFAYCWAARPGSRAWWLALLLFANKEPQDLFKLGADLERQRKKKLR